MVGIKGNNNSKGLRPMSTQFLILVAFALIVVTTVKTFGKGSWHAKATLDDHNNGVQHPQRQDINQKATSSEAASIKSANVADITIAKDVNSDIKDNNLIQFIFSSLDGKEGQEGEYDTMYICDRDTICCQTYSFVIDSFHLLHIVYKI